MFPRIFHASDYSHKLPWAFLGQRWATEGWKTGAIAHSCSTGARNIGLGYSVLRWNLGMNPKWNITFSGQQDWPSLNFLCGRFQYSLQHLQYLYCNICSLTRGGTAKFTRRWTWTLVCLSVTLTVFFVVNCRGHSKLRDHFPFENF